MKKKRKPVRVRYVWLVEEGYGENERPIRVFSTRLRAENWSAANIDRMSDRESTITKFRLDNRDLYA